MRRHALGTDSDRERLGGLGMHAWGGAVPAPPSANATVFPRAVLFAAADDKILDSATYKQGTPAEAPLLLETVNHMYIYIPCKYLLHIYIYIKNPGAYTPA